MIKVHIVSNQLSEAVMQSIINDGVECTVMSLCSALAVIAEQHGDIDHACNKGSVKVRASKDFTGCLGNIKNATTDKKD